MWDSQTGQGLLTLKGGTWNHCVAFSTDGNRLACGGPDGTIRIYDDTPLPEKP